MVGDHPLAYRTEGVLSRAVLIAHSGVVNNRRDPYITYIEECLRETKDLCSYVFPPPLNVYLIGYS